MKLKPSTSGSGYEKSDAHALSILSFAFFLFLGLLILMGAAFATYSVFKKQITQTQKDSFYRAEKAPGMPVPVLQVHPSMEYQNLKDKMDRRMASYGWIDKDKGIVHIPIDTAIEKTAQAGLAQRQSGKEPLS